MFNFKLIFMVEIFSNEKINVGRQVDLDLAKAGSIIFMVFVHCLLLADSFNSSFSPIFFHGIDDLLGGPMCAPLFMFCMGVGLVYSRNAQSDIMIKRGISLLILGILVNVGEFISAHFLSGFLLNDWTTFPIYGGLMLFAVDILAFAGMSFIVFGIFKKLNLSNMQMLLIAFALSIVGSLMRMSVFEYNYINLLLGYLIGTDVQFTTFPFFNWFIFPVAGYVWGQYYIRAYKDRFFRFWPIFFIIPVIYFYFSISIPGAFLIDDSHYYFMTTIDALFCLIYIHGAMGLFYFLSDKLPQNLLDIAGTLSRYINGIYIAQWFLIPLIIILLVYLVDGMVFNDLNVTIISIVVLILSTWLAVGYKKFRKRFGGIRKKKLNII